MATRSNARSTRGRGRGGCLVQSRCTHQLRPARGVDGWGRARRAGRRPKIDRIACPWLIKWFVDKDAQFIFLPADVVASFAAKSGAIPYEIEGVELTHDGPLCSFDALIKKHNLTDPALAEMATIIRGADTDTHGLAPQCLASTRC